MKGVALLCVCATLCFLAACHTEESWIENSASTPTREQTAGIVSAREETDATASEPSETPLESSVSEEKDMFTVEIAAGGKTFTATLYDNPSANALLALLPMTLDMNELNGNEKYFYLEGTLPTDASRPSGIHTGDLMLYGNNCLVLFYEDFSTSYSYTPLGRIDDPEGLASALGGGSVQVTFQKG